MDYTGSQEEKDDIKGAFEDGEGDIEHIMAHIPFSTYKDEPRIVSIVESLVKAKELSSTPTWQKQIRDEKAKKARKKRGEVEAAQAEETAKELGVWDEFYGSGKKGKRKGKAPAKEEGAEDDSALKALIQKRQTNRGSFLDNLAAKYGAIEDGEEIDMGETPKKKTAAAKGKGRKRTRAEGGEEDVEMPSRSKRKKTPELDDAEFGRIQARLLAQKEANGAAKSSVPNAGGRLKRK
jgi:DnaJ family protein C protein 9